jgi:hypothetical protein
MPGVGGAMQNNQTAGRVSTKQYPLEKMAGAKKRNEGQHSQLPVH